MYKKAAILKLRFQTPRGLLSVEQLFDLKMTELTKLCKEQLEVVKKSKGSDDEELSFLEGTGDGKDNIEILKFEILKDVYLTKKHQKEQDAEDVKKKEQLAQIDELIAEKQNEALKGKSVEELMKMREELMK